MKTRIGFIGAGGIANRHIDNLLTFDDVTVVAVADPRRDRAEAAAARTGARVYNGHDPLLRMGYRRSRASHTTYRFSLRNRSPPIWPLPRRLALP